MHKKLTFVWLLLGLGAKLQVVASLSITEMIVLISAPFIMVKDLRRMKRTGVILFFVLSLLVIFGCIVASMANHTPRQYVLRGLAVTCIISCAIVFSHWLLQRDPGGFKWYVLMLPLSAVFSTFFLKQSVEVTMLGESAEEIMSGPIYWINRLQPLVMAPTKGWYLQTPWFINVFAPLFMAGFSVMTTISGRSAALSAAGFAILVLIGGKTRRSMGRIARNFWKLCFLGVGIIIGMYLAYKTAAMHGWLGEDARKKYETQTEGGSGGIGRLILGGRGDSFIGLLACRDRPIVGWGPWAQDENGYTEEFMSKYGTWEDVQNITATRQREMKYGILTRRLSVHSYITEFWAWYGIFGLVFWAYAIFVILRYLKQDVAVVPQWFAWLACSVPGMFWGIFFSPLSDRFGVPLFIVACLMARAIRKGDVVLPRQMIAEIEQAR